MKLTTEESYDILSLKTIYKPTKSYKIDRLYFQNPFYTWPRTTDKKVLPWSRAGGQRKKWTSPSQRAETESNPETSPTRELRSLRLYLAGFYQCYDQWLLCFPFSSFLSKSNNYLIHPDPPEPHGNLSERTEWTSPTNCGIWAGYNNRMLLLSCLPRVKRGECVLCLGERMPLRRIHTETRIAGHQRETSNSHQYSSTLIPEHIIRLHFPDSLADWCNHVTKCASMIYE